MSIDSSFGGYRGHEQGPDAHGGPQRQRVGVYVAVEKIGTDPGRAALLVHHLGIMTGGGTSMTITVVPEHHRSIVGLAGT